ncbi:MAG: PAS domain-containing protein, partial [Deltaproteobacteria bacterium]|nr:PAS domain-containing protein [Deltaproteobacteria bacterium]
EWNRAAEVLTGCPRSEALGKPYWDVLHELAHPDTRSEERRASYERAVRLALQTGVPSPALTGLRPARSVRADGVPVFFEQYVFPIKTSRGFCLGFIGHDVTERVKAIADRAESEARSRLLIQNLNDIVTIIDAEGTQLFVSDQVERILGYQPSELAGTSGFRLIHPDDLPGMVRALAEGLETPCATRTVEYRCRHKDGSWVPLEAVGSNLLDSPVRGIMLNIRDVSERKRTERTLKESEERYRVATVATGQLIYDYEIASGRIQWAGAIEPITGHRPEEFERFGLADWTEMIHPDDRERTTGSLVRSCAESRPFRVEYRLRRKDGSYTFVEDNGGFLYDQGGAPFRMLGAMKDVADRRHSEAERAKLEGQLQQAMKMEAVGRLAGGVAHDFNNLLTGITGNIELALMEMTPADPLAETLREVEKAARSAASLTRQLLAFSRKQLIEPKVININDLMGNLKRMLGRILGEDIELSAVLDPELGAVKVDPGQMEQILVNLAVNARDAMPQGGCLSVRTSDTTLDEEWCAHHPSTRPGDYVKLEVSDTGQGMTDEVKAHLFEPFFTTKPKGRGTGLGLATIYGAVKQSGGTIEVYSEVGRGTTFKIYLPRVAGKAQKLEPGNRGEELPRGNETVLVVEDEAWVRDLAARALKRLGYQVLQAANGSEAFVLASGHSGPIHLLMTDIVMPGINGRQLAERLKPLRPDMNVLYCSGYTEDVIVHHGAVEEGLHFLAKPYTPQSLARKVREVLG